LARIAVLILRSLVLWVFPLRWPGLRPTPLIPATLLGQRRARDRTQPPLPLPNEDLSKLEAAIRQLLSVRIIHESHPFLAQLGGKELPGFIRKLSQIKRWPLRTWCGGSIPSVRPVRPLGAIGSRATITITIIRPLIPVVRTRLTIIRPLISILRTLVTPGLTLRV
jgi:hypothetical protein